MWSKILKMRQTPLITLSALTLLAGTATAHAETFGRTTVGATASGALRADYKRGSKFTLAEAGTATNLCARVDGNGNAASYQTLRFVMYRDVNGLPGAKLAQTGEIRINSGTPARWVCGDIGWTPLTAGSYWLMIHTGGPDGSGPTRYYYDGAANFLTNVDNYLDSSADPAGAMGTGNGTLSIYATYIPATKLQNAGVTTVGTTVSAGLRTDFKRGSSITFSQSGQVKALTAYLDGLGTSVVASQEVRLALYEDTNGAPGKLVTESSCAQYSSAAHPRGGTRSPHLKARCTRENTG